LELPQTDFRYIGNLTGGIRPFVRGNFWARFAGFDHEGRPIDCTRLDGSVNRGYFSTRSACPSNIEKTKESYIVLAKTKSIPGAGAFARHFKAI
jgi:hypothetical protein